MCVYVCVCICVLGVCVSMLCLCAACVCICVCVCVCVYVSVRVPVCWVCVDVQELLLVQRTSDELVLGDQGSRFPSSTRCLSSLLPLTSENMGSFLAKSTTRVMAGVMILVNSLKASRSTLSPSGMETMGDWPMSSG